MIQRIQSIYLFLAGVIPAICIFLPLARFHVGEGYYSMLGFKYDVVNMGATVTTHPWGVLCMALLATIVSFYAIFCYRNRKRQMRLCTWASLCIIIFYVAYFAYAVAFMSHTSSDFMPSLPVALPLLSLFFLTLARKGIKHDEDLIRSADRIR